MTYEERCREACPEGCGKDAALVGGSVHFIGEEEDVLDCTAPSRDEFEAEQAARITELESRLKRWESVDTECPLELELKSGIAQLELELERAKVTIETLSNDETVKALTQSLKDLKEGRVVPFVPFDDSSEED